MSLKFRSLPTMKFGTKRANLSTVANPFKWCEAAITASDFLGILLFSRNRNARGPSWSISYCSARSRARIDCTATNVMVGALSCRKMKLHRVTAEDAHAIEQANRRDGSLERILTADAVLYRRHVRPLFSGSSHWLDAAVLFCHFVTDIGMRPGCRNVFYSGNAPAMF